MGLDDSDNEDLDRRPQMPDTSLPDDDHVDDPRRASSQGRKSEKKSAAQQLVELGREIYEFFTDTGGKAYGVRKGGHVARPLTSSKKSIRKELGGLFCRMNGKPASQNALTEAVASLEYEAEEAEPVDLYLRAARPSDDEIYIDVGDRAERVIRITADGWEVLDATAKIPVLFRRTNLTLALPTPEPGGDLDRLWQFVNVCSDVDRQLLRGWLVSACLLVGRPCPIMALFGEQGTAKTSSARSVFALFDPTAAPVRRPPKDEDRLLHAGAHSRSMIFDNLSSIPQWLSDGMCRFVTGEGDVDRALYTDDDARVIEVQGVGGITGIDVGGLSADFAERTVWGNLEVIPPSQRYSERELNAAWDNAYASMVGGLLDLVVLALQKLPEVDLDYKPRMADFAEVLAALDLATGSDSLSHYIDAQESVASDIVTTDRFLSTLAETITTRWAGTGKELHGLLDRPDDAKYWPEPRGMAGKLKRVAPDLRKVGWTVEHIPADPESKRAQSWVLVPPGEDLITDADIAIVQVSREMHDRDVADWIDHAVEHGLDQVCVEHHLLSLRGGLSISCSGCSTLQRPSGFAARVTRSKAIDARLFDELSRLGLTLSKFDQLLADRSVSVEGGKS